MRNSIKKVIVLLLALSTLIISGVQVNASSDQKTTFKDVKSTSWYYTYVTKLADLKITGGYTDGTYKPNNSVTRAEFVTFLCNAKGYKQMQGDPFVDSQKSWASGYITAALANGIIDIPSDQKFNPNFAITRQDAVEMMCRALNITPDESTKTPYADVTSNTGYSTTAYSNYLMTGTMDKDKRYFYPTSKITRAETATIIVNAYEYNADKMGYLNTKISEEKKKKGEAEKHQSWLNSIDKGVSQELLNNTIGLTGGKTVEECNEYAINSLKSDYTAWWKDCNITNIEDFKKSFVEGAKKFTNVWYNKNYMQLDSLKNGMNETWASINIENYLNKNLKTVLDNKVVTEGKFFTGEGLIFIRNQSPVLRGTLKYRYLTPTSIDALKADICGETGKHAECNIWYEEDIEISFIPENGLRVSEIKELSQSKLAR